MTTLTDITDAGLCVTPVVCRAGHVSACRDIRRARVEKALIEALLAPEVVEAAAIDAWTRTNPRKATWEGWQEWDKETFRDEASKALTAALEALTKDAEASA